MSKCQKMLLNNSPATFLQEEIFSFYQTRAANHITEQKEACIYSLTKLSQAKSVPSKGAECLVDLCFKFLGLTQAFKADLFFEASANLWTFNFRVPKKNESIQETPRAKKQVNASLSLYETEINGTDGCIYVFLKCLACPFFKNKTKHKHSGHQARCYQNKSTWSLYCSEFQQHLERNSTFISLRSHSSSVVYSVVRVTAAGNKLTPLGGIFQNLDSDLVLKAEVLKPNHFVE